MDGSVIKDEIIGPIFSDILQRKCVCVCVCVCVCSLIGNQQNVFCSFMMTDKRVHLIYGLGVQMLYAVFLSWLQAAFRDSSNSDDGSRPWQA